jgi:hypothetical protein
MGFGLRRHGLWVTAAWALGYGGMGFGLRISSRNFSQSADTIAFITTTRIARLDDFGRLKEQQHQQLMW